MICALEAAVEAKVLQLYWGASIQSEPDGPIAMDQDQLRNVLGFVGIISVMVGAGLSFRAQTKKAKYDDLMKSGQKINLNLFTLLSAYLRKDTDPLKEPHSELARIGIIHFFLVLLGIVVVPTAIFAAFRILGK